MDFMGGVGIEVVGGLIVASLAWLGAKLLRVRPKIADHLRGRLCRHVWRPIPTDLGGWPTTRVTVAG